MAYDNRNSGVLFKNTKRGDNPKAPTLKGTGHVTIGGVDYELDIAAWTHESAKAGKFLSLAIKLRGERGDRSLQGTQQMQQQAHQPRSADDDSIPF